MNANVLRRVTVETVPIRDAWGRPRAVDDVDRQIAELVQRALTAGKRALVHVLDVSKTGMRTPSLACVTALRQRYGDAITVLVDAAQWRLPPPTLARYHGAGFWLVLTGSKFMGGAPFSGALVLPTSSAAEVPVPSVGLLLRWESALHELTRYTQLPAAAAAQALCQFNACVRATLACRDGIAPLPDDVAQDAAAPNIHAFTVQRCGVPLDLLTLKAVHRWLYSNITAALPALPPAERALAALVCHVGQPVVVSEQPAVVALRIAPSANLVCAIAGGHDVAPDVRAVFDKLELILANLEALRAFYESSGELQ